MAEVLKDNPIAQRILHEGVRLFAEKGYAATTTREIVEAAGVTKPMLYYYFQSKEGLCRSAITLYLAEIRGRADKVFETPMGALDRLVEVVWVHLGFILEEPEVFRMGASFIYVPPAEIADTEFYAAMRDVSSYLERAIAELQQAGEVRPGSSATLVRVITGLLRVWADDTLHGDGGKPTRDTARQAVLEVLNGFRARSTEVT